MLPKATTSTEANTSCPVVLSTAFTFAVPMPLPCTVPTIGPTAGFWAGQTDEGEMGLTYDELDRYLATGDAEPEVRERIEARRQNSEHKRRPVPICIPEA